MLNWVHRSLVRWRHPLASFINDKAVWSLTWMLQILRQVLVGDILMRNVLLRNILILNILLRNIRLRTILRDGLSRMLSLYMLMSSLWAHARRSLRRRHPSASIIHDERITGMLRRMLSWRDL